MAATRASVVGRPPSRRADSRVSSLPGLTHTIVFSAVLSDDPDATWTAAAAAVGGDRQREAVREAGALRCLGPYYGP